MASYCSVSYPPYCGLFKRREKLFIVGGGGGTARTGVKNFIQVFGAQRNADGLDALTSIEMADAVMWMGGGPDTNRIYYSVGSAVRTGILQNNKLVDDEECIDETLMKTGEFLTAACVSNNFLIVGTNQGRIYLKDLKEKVFSPLLLTRENASIEHVVARDDHFLVCYSNQIIELHYDDEATPTSSIFSANSKGRIKRIAAHGQSVIFLMGNYLRNTEKRKCQLRSDGTAMTTLPEAEIIAVGMLDGHVSLHSCDTLGELKVLRPVNCLITSLTFLNEEVSGVELGITSLDDNVCRCFVKYGEGANANFLIHIAIMLLVIAGHAITLVFSRSTESA